MIMSTSMLASAIGPRMANAMPGRSGTPSTVILASSRLNAMPEMMACSMFSSSSNVMRVPMSVEFTSVNDDSTRSFTLYLPANSTERICSTLEPSEASSSISSKVTVSRRRASGTMRGSVV